MMRENDDVTSALVQGMLSELLKTGADDAPAIAAPSRDALTFGALRALIADTIARLTDLGIGGNGRVAIVLPNGPEMATCFIAFASGFASAPLNPAYTADEFQFYFSDLDARSLIIERGSDSAAVDVAGRLGMQVIDLVAQTRRGAGDFTLEPRGAHSGPSLGRSGCARPDDVSLVLHTSGTTSRPKVVPLTQANLAAAASNVRATLQLVPSDCGLNIMPLFHIHGLVAGLLAPLAAGSRVFCAPGFNPLKFFAWMDEARPTWYTAAPTMHQAIVRRASKNAAIIARNPLRFVRSSSAAMSAQLISEIEATFSAPLIEAYGMTEAAHQIASNPLPPEVRRRGTVGLPTGTEVATIDRAGSLLPRGAAGEIVIRGPGVTAGYENNPTANAQGVIDGWFLTGDMGVIDADGYVRITGRIKEIINRGGEKISPAEVEAVLLDHPAVAQAACFGVPHPKLGEEVGAAVVLRGGREASERDLRTFVKARAAAYKVPGKILFVGEIPKGATGKVQRIGMARRLGLA